MVDQFLDRIRATCDGLTAVTTTARALPSRTSLTSESAGPASMMMRAAPSATSLRTQPIRLIMSVPSSCPRAGSGVQLSLGVGSPSMIDSSYRLSGELSRLLCMSFKSFSISSAPPSLP